MRSIHNKCFSNPCCCILPEDGYSNVYITSKVVETKKALRVQLKRQKVNGIDIPAGYEVWIPGGSTSFITGDRRYTMMPNWKMNQIIRIINIDKQKNYESKIHM